VIPPSSTAERADHPKARPASTPGVKFNAASSIPARTCDRSATPSSSPLYSRPSANRSNRTPISAAVVMKSSLSRSSGTRPDPMTSPASR